MKKLIAALILTTFSMTASAGAWVRFQCDFGGLPIWLIVSGEKYYISDGARHWEVEGDFDRESTIVTFTDKPEGVSFVIDVKTIDNNRMVKADAYLYGDVFKGVCSAETGNYD